jgi:hypothetical protein
MPIKYIIVLFVKFTWCFHNKTIIYFIFVDKKWLSLFVIENMTFGFGRLSVNINGITTVDWPPCFYKLTYDDIFCVGVMYSVFQRS